LSAPPNATLEKKGQNLKGKHTKYRSLAFTEQGVAMLSSVLKSESAIKVNIAIMRAFVQLRHLMMGNGGLVNRLSNVEAKDLEQDDRLTGHDEHLLDHDRKFDELFEAMASSNPRVYFITTRSSMPMYLSAT